MLYKNQLEELSALCRKLDAGLLQSQESDVLPLSFFSSSYDILKQMMNLLQSVEESQVEQMQQQLRIHKEIITEQILAASRSAPVSPEKEEERQEVPVEEETSIPQNEEQETVVEEPVEETHRTHSVEWKIAITDRFLFLKELFSNDKEMMDEVLNDLRLLPSLSEGISYLDKRFQWNWEDTAPSVFRLLLEKTYV